MLFLVCCLLVVDCFNVLAVLVVVVCCVCVVCCSLFNVWCLLVVAGSVLSVAVNCLLFGVVCCWLCEIVCGGSVSLFVVA